MTNIVNSIHPNRILNHNVCGSFYSFTIVMRFKIGIYSRTGMLDVQPGTFSQINSFIMGAQWLSGRVLDSRPKGRGFEPHRRHCVVSLSKTHLS